ncbi:MAG: hypothetical protein WBD81_05505 [Collimonas pratensis]|uniref:hypothetical protein n=1 Tax=Collimonas pratensis TaxID=279113 RepID=UPI003C775C52
MSNKKTPIVEIDLDNFGRGFHDAVPFHAFSRLSVGRNEASNLADMRASQLSALLLLTIGEGGDHFRNCSDDTQENVLWLAQGLAEELKELLSLVREEGRQLPKGGAA